jgi:hypothetical protein
MPMSLRSAVPESAKCLVLGELERLYSGHSDAGTDGAIRLSNLDEAERLKNAYDLAWLECRNPAHA